MSCTGSIDIGLCHGLKDVGVLCVMGFERPLVTNTKSLSVYVDCLTLCHRLVYVDL